MMLISFDGQPHNINFNDFSRTDFCVGLISVEEFCNKYSELGISYREFIGFDFSDNSFRSSVCVFAQSFGFSIKVISASKENNAECHCCVYVNKSFVLIITAKDEDKTLYNSFYQAVNNTRGELMTSERFIYLYFDALMSGDGKMTEETEYSINELEERVIKDIKSSNVNEQILSYNKKLMLLRNYYEQLIDIAERLYDNENGLFDSDKLSYFRMTSDKAGRLRNEINLLRENLVRLREAYQARLDLKMNSTMTLFTVITTIFLPLTLITGWYGMNFNNMPEISSKYGYPAVIAVSITVVLICILIFRKKKLF